MALSRHYLPMALRRILEGVGWGWATTYSGQFVFGKKQKKMFSKRGGGVGGGGGGVVVCRSDQDTISTKDENFNGSISSELLLHFNMQLSERD